MHAACRLHYDGMQEVAGCSNLHAGGCRLQQHACSLHAGCMQPALRFKCSRLHWNTRAHSRRRRRDAGRRRPASRGRRPAHQRRLPACRLQAGCMQGVDAKKIRRDWTCSFSAYFSERIFLFLALKVFLVYFSLWQHVVMSSRCHLRRRWPAGTSWLLFTSASKKWRKRMWTSMFRIS